MSEPEQYVGTPEYAEGQRDYLANPLCRNPYSWVHSKEQFLAWEAGYLAEKAKANG